MASAVAIEIAIMQTRAQALGIEDDCAEMARLAGHAARPAVSSLLRQAIERRATDLGIKARECESKASVVGPAASAALSKAYDSAEESIYLRIKEEEACGRRQAEALSEAESCRSEAAALRAETAALRARVQTLLQQQEQLQQAPELPTGDLAYRRPVSPDSVAIKDDQRPPRPLRDRRMSLPFSPRSTLPDLALMPRGDISPASSTTSLAAAPPPPPPAPVVLEDFTYEDRVREITLVVPLDRVAKVLAPSDRAFSVEIVPESVTIRIHPARGPVGPGFVFAIPALAAAVVPAKSRAELRSGTVTLHLIKRDRGAWAAGVRREAEMRDASNAPFEKGNLPSNEQLQGMDVWRIA